MIRANVQTVLFRRFGIGLLALTLLISQSLFNTLMTNGYLKSIRDEKIENILNGDNSINN